MNRELERADLILCPRLSLCAYHTMVTNGLPTACRFINPFGVDTAIFKKRENVPARPRFVCVGIICFAGKDTSIFSAPSESVKKHRLTAELICVGDVKTDFRKEWPRWRETFTHVHHLPHQELAGLLQTCTAFVFPYRSEEGFARVISGSHGCRTAHSRKPRKRGDNFGRGDGVEGFIVRGRESAAYGRRHDPFGERPRIKPKNGRSRLAKRRGEKHLAGLWRPAAGRISKK